MPDEATQTESMQHDRFDLRALHETSRLLSSSLDVDFVLNNLLLIAMTKLLVTRGVALLDDPLSSSFRVAAVKGIGKLKAGDQVAVPGADVDAGVIRDNIPPALADHRIAVLLPVVFMNRLIGLVGLGSKARGSDFLPAELEFVQSLISMSSAAIHNSIMVDQLKQANRDLDGKIQQLNTLFDLSQELNATIDRGRLLKLLSFALMGQFLIGRYMLLLRRDEEGRSSDNGVMCVVASKGPDQFEMDEALIQHLCELAEIVQPEEEAQPLFLPFKKAGIELLLPLRMHGKTEGILCLGKKMTGQPFDADDIEFLSALGNMALVSIQNTFLVEEQIEMERMEEEIRLAKEIQEGLLPRRLPEVDHLDLAAVAIPSRAVGGDYFEVAELDDDRLLVAIADVTGKGVPASLLMANIQACLHVLVPIEITLTDATALINRVIHRNTAYDKFITFFWAIYDETTRTLRYVNAGHNPPMYVPAHGSVRLLDKGGILLGVFGGARYEEEEITLSTDDVIALYTDGVTESLNSAEEEYGEERLQQVLLQHRGGSSQDILRAIQQDVERFTEGKGFGDDFTMVVLKAR